MKNVRISLEYLDADGSPTMRWERHAASDAGGTFELLGRAFEVAQREDAANFSMALASFLRGAMVGRQDVLDALADE